MTLTYNFEVIIGTINLHKNYKFVLIVFHKEHKEMNCEPIKNILQFWKQIHLLIKLNFTRVAGGSASGNVLSVNWRHLAMSSEKN